MKPKTFAGLFEEAEGHEDYWIAGTVLEFTEEITAIMEREGITRSELARRLGTSPAYVSKILQGNANFTLTTMARLAKVLGADLRIQLKPTASKSQGARTPAELKTQSRSSIGSRRSTGVAAAAQ
jgi:transcriptional regulator with XRE-family HTH domain